MERTKDEIPHLEEITSLMRKFSVKFAYVFGSFIQNQRGPLSDIDLAIFLEPRLSKYQRHRRRLELHALLEELLVPEQVDLVVLNDIGLLLADRIVRQGISFYIYDEAVKQQFEEAIIIRGLDFRHFAEQFDRWQSQTLTSDEN